MHDAKCVNNLSLVILPAEENKNGRYYIFSLQFYVIRNLSNANISLFNPINTTYCYLLLS